MSERYLVTGANGLVGYAILKKLIADGQEVIAQVRDRVKLEVLGDIPATVTVIEQDITEPLEYDGKVDYIIHGAAPTSSTFMVQSPVETIDAIVHGSRNVLELARIKGVKAMVYLSSMEVYGQSETDELLTEDKQFYLDPLAIRSDYPLGKRMAENLCVAYAYEYDVPVTIARLAQVISQQVLPDDNRIVATVRRAVASRNNIVLATDGSSKQTYVGIDDAVTGIMTILAKGIKAQAYNVANEETYCSIREMAEYAASELVNSEISVYVEPNHDATKYPPARKWNISSQKLRALDWQPRQKLKEMLG